MKRNKKNATPTATRKNKKLKLQRETVRVLASEELSDVAGGGLQFSANSCDFTC